MWRHVGRLGYIRRVAEGASEQQSDDEQHLRILSIFHYVVAGIGAVFGCFPIIHMAVGVMMVTGSFPSSTKGNPPPDAFGWLFIVFAGAMMLAFWGFAVAVALAGRDLARRRRYTFCLVMAGVSTMCMPFGTLLGVFTIIVLMRPSVKQMFHR